MLWCWKMCPHYTQASAKLTRTKLYWEELVTFLFNQSRFCGGNLKAEPQKRQTARSFLLKATGVQMTTKRFPKTHS